MTTSLFLLLMALVAAGAVVAFLVSARDDVGRLVKRHGTMPPPMIGAISILFGLFIGFGSAEISQRGSGLRLAAQREVSAARSILNFTTGIGPPAHAVRQTAVEYLRVVSTTERDWLGNPEGKPSGDPCLVPTTAADDLSKEARLGSAQTRKGSPSSSMGTL